VNDEKRDVDSVTDDPEIYDGAHVSLQIVGKRLQEEKMLAIAAHVESLLASSQQ
jgi:amidase